MPKGLVIEINVYRGRAMNIMVRMPVKDSECDVVSAEMIDYISAGMRKEDAGIFPVIEFFFTVTENLKCEFPGLASAVKN